MKKILVIEDEEPLREDIIETLECLEYEGIAAENGAIGVKLALQHLPDLIICDVMMPELDGYGVFTCLRADPQTATIPFIFLSAKADKSDLRQGMNLGADDYLTKPFTIAELSEAISAQIQKRELIADQANQKLDELRTNISRSLPHEFRTPLQGILSLSEIVISEYDLLDSKTMRNMLYEINNSAQRLSKLIHNFMLYAELEVIATDPERVAELRSHQSFTPETMIKYLASIKFQKADREADLHLNLQDATIQISEQNLQKIAEEIIDNSLKFSSAGTPIYIESSVNDSQYIFSVVNYGQGMTQAQIAKVGAYMQFDRKLYEQQGSGLGLQIAKRLVELHEGSLTIDSNPGKDTKVEIALPIFKE